MKYLKSSLQDLREIFAQTVTLQNIAEPLASFSHSESVSDAIEFMREREFDVIGVRFKGVVISYAVRSELTEDRSLKDQTHDFGKEDVLSINEPLLSALNILRERRYVFVRVLGHVGGIITRGDLQKAPVRMWLFSLVSLLEMQMLRLIRERYPAESWISALTPERLQAANRIFDERRRRNEENDLSECLQFGDKGKIFKNDEDLFRLTGFSSKQSLESFVGKVVKLRDSLAHAHNILGGNWPGIVDLVLEMERVLDRLEKAAIL